MREFEARGIPAVAVATVAFIDGASAQAEALGTDPAYHFVPHPIRDRTDDELKQLADDHREAILALLTRK